MSPRWFAATLLCLAPSSALAGPGGGLPAPAEEAQDEGALRLWAQIQTWITAMDQDSSQVADPATYGDPEHDPGFSIPRGRLGASGALPAGPERLQARYGISFGVGSPYDALFQANSDAQIVDAYGELILANDFGPSAVTVGIHRIPFSRELLQSSRTLTFQERSVASTYLGHGRDAGLTLTQGLNLGEDGLAALRLGAFNGNESFLFDTDPGLLLAGRAEVALGRAYQTFDPDLEPALGIGLNALNNAQLATRTTRYGLDLLLRYRWVTFTGEYLQGTIAPGDSGAVLPTTAGPIDQVGLTTQLSFFAPVGEGRGGPELAGRLAWYDDDDRSDDLGDVQIVHAGLNWHDLVPHVDAGAGAILRFEGGRRELENDTVRLWIQFRPTTPVAIAPPG